MTWLTSPVERRDLEGLLAAAPAAGGEWKRYVTSVLEQAPAELTELCRLRIAQLHECESELRITHSFAGVPAEKAQALADWERSELFSPVERAALAVAEKWPWRVHDITDDEMGELRDRLGVEDAVALATSFSLFDVHCRLRLAFEIEPVDIDVAHRFEFGADLH